MKVYLSYCAETNGADESDDADSKCALKPKSQRRNLKHYTMYSRACERSTEHGASGERSAERGASGERSAARGASGERSAEHGARSEREAERGAWSGACEI